MKISWTSFKISIAGAKLSHLVKKNRAWDHGTMIEQVKGIFLLLQKIRIRRHAEPVKKYMTTPAYEKLKKELEKLQIDKDPDTLIELKEIDIIEVHEGNKNKCDNFLALVKGRRRRLPEEMTINSLDLKNNEINDFEEKWVFIRQNDWWVLDDMQSK